MALTEEAPDEQLKAWEKQVWNDPGAMEQLGGKYEKEKRFADAKRAYARALEAVRLPNAACCWVTFTGDSTRSINGRLRSKAISSTTFRDSTTPRFTTRWLRA